MPAVVIRISAGPGRRASRRGGSTRQGRRRGGHRRGKFNGVTHHASGRECGLNFSAQRDGNAAAQREANARVATMAAGVGVRAPERREGFLQLILAKPGIKRVVNDGQALAAEKEFFGAALAERNVHPIIEISAENCTDQMGVAGPWYERLPHFKMGFTPSSGEELQAEYFVPRSRAVEAIKAVAALRDEIKPLLMITEIRTIDADNLWMSTCYQQPSVAIHFTLKQDVEGVPMLLPKIEEKLAPFGVRPHWGKLFTIAPTILQSRYEKLEDFKQLVKQYDQEGKFRNEFLERNLFGANRV